MNRDLVRPFVATVVPQWSNTFGYIDSAYLRSEIGSALRPHFNSAAESLVTKLVNLGVSQGRVEALKAAVFEDYERLFDKCATLAYPKVSNGQKEASRDFQTAIQNKMAPAYQKSYDDSGIGWYERTRGNISRHVDDLKDSMFTDLANSTREKLEDLLGEANSLVKVFTSEIIQHLSARFCTLWEKPDGNQDVRAVAVRKLYELYSRVKNLRDEINAVVHGAPLNEDGLHAARVRAEHSLESTGQQIGEPRNEAYASQGGDLHYHASQIKKKKGEPSQPAEGR